MVLSLLGFYALISIHALVKRATATTQSLRLVISISIHALVKRATSSSPPCSSKSCISIHALVKRATSFHCLYYTAPLYFNPRPREEGDKSRSKKLSRSGNFNPRPREEGDQILSRLPLLQSDFNPRPREEGDAHPRKRNFYKILFQSTPS